MTYSSALALLLAAACACARKSEAPVIPPDAPVMVDASPAPVATAPGNYTCKADGDCVNSCLLGAVSRAWLATYHGPECEDGCASKVSQAPRCIDGECVAYERDLRTGLVRRSDECTKRSP